MTDHPSLPGLYRRALLACLLGLPGAVLPLAPALWPTLASAEAVQRHWQIPAGPLATTLTLFGREAGILLSFNAADTDGKHSPGVSGTLSIDQALQALIAGSGLSITRTAPHSYRLVAPTSAANTDNNAIQLGPVRVRGYSEQGEAYRAAGSVNVITQEHIERFRGTSVGDIFQGIPGVLIGENRNSGGLDVNIRGMQGQGRVPVLVDGARQETTVYRGYSGVASRSYVDPDLIGGIRIDKGPTLSAQGTGAVGGLVAMRTVGVNDIIKGEKSWGVRIRGSAIGNNTGSALPSNTQAGYAVGGEMFETAYRIECQYDCSRDNPLPDPIASPDGLNRPDLFDLKGWAGSIAAAKSFQYVDLVAGYAQRSQGNYYAGKHGPGARIDLSDRVQRGFWVDVYPKLEGASRFRLGERIVNTEYASRSSLLKANIWLPHDQSLELGFVKYDSEYGEIMPSQLLRFGQALQSPSSTVDATTLTARYQWNPVDSELFDLEANLWHTDTISNNVNYPESLTEQIPFMEEMMVAEHYKRLGGDITNTMTFDVLGSLQWRYGVAWQQEDVRPAEDIPQGTDTFLRDGKRREVSAFTALQWKPINSLTLDAGIRWSDFAANDRTDPVIPEPDDSACVDLNGDGACDQISVHHTASRGSAPVASLTWEPKEGLQFYLRYAEAMRMPSLFESTRGFSATQAFDVAIKPEHATNREAGINLLRDGLLFDKDKLRLKASYFRNTVDDYLTRTSPNLWEHSGYLGGHQLFTLRNIEKVSFHGAELSLEHDMGLLFWSIAGTYYTHTKTCHYGSYRRYQCTDYGIANSYINNMIPPEWHASATLGARMLNWRLVFGARATFMGKRPAQPRWQDDTQRGMNLVVPWHDYTLVDLFARYRLNKHLAAEFNIDNLTDRYYLDALGLGLLPAPGRTARLSLTMHF